MNQGDLFNFAGFLTTISNANNPSPFAFHSKSDIIARLRCRSQAEARERQTGEEIIHMDAGNTRFADNANTKPNSIPPVRVPTKSTPKAISVAERSIPSPSGSGPSESIPELIANVDPAPEVVQQPIPHADPTLDTITQAESVPESVSEPIDHIDPAPKHLPSLDESTSDSTTTVSTKPKRKRQPDTVQVVQDGSGRSTRSKAAKEEVARPVKRQRRSTAQEGSKLAVRGCGSAKRGGK